MPQRQRRRRNNPFSRRNRGWDFPTLNYVLQANSAVLGAREPAVRDIGLIISAVNAPFASAGGADAYPRPFDKIAALGWSLARNHGFIDGNKRTAFTAMTVALSWNKHYLTWDVELTTTIMTLVAAGYLDREGLAFALRLGCGLDPTDSAAP